MNTVAPIEGRPTFARSLHTRAGRWLLLCAFLLLSVPTLRAQLTYKAENGAITITGYSGNIDQLIIPETINGLPVRSVGNYAFSGRTGLTSLSIPNSVTSIGVQAFRECTGLTSLSIPNSVTSTGYAAFYRCTGLTSVTIPNSVTSIGYYAFSGCTGLASVSIPNSVTSIGDYAFAECNGLTSVSIPDSVTSIGGAAFSGCTGLTGVYFEGDEPGSGSFAFGPPTTLYRLPGTTGWEETFSGRPTVLWNPSAPIEDPAFGVRNGTFGFKITGTANIPVVVEACDSLTQPVWVPLVTITLTGGSSLFSDPDWASHPSRVYRFRSP